MQILPPWAGIGVQNCLLTYSCCRLLALTRKRVVRGCWSLRRLRGYGEHFVKGKSIKEIGRDLKASRNTVRNVLCSGGTSFEYE